MPLVWPLALIADDVARPDAQPVSFVVRVIELADFQRETPTTDAAIEAVAHPLHHGDPLIQRLAEAATDFAPVRFGRRASVGQTRHNLFNLFDGQSDLLGDQDEGQSSNV